MGVVNYMANEMVKEIGNKTREFYEFVLPPIDMVTKDDNLVVSIDMPGFNKKDIKIRLDKNVLSISAVKKKGDDQPPDDGKHGTVIWSQRPKRIEKKIRLPIDVKEDEEITGSAKYDQGVLVLTIPIKHGKEISIE